MKVINSQVSIREVENITSSLNTSQTPDVNSTITYNQSVIGSPTPVIIGAIFGTVAVIAIVIIGLQQYGVIPIESATPEGSSIDLQNFASQS